MLIPQSKMDTDDAKGSVIMNTVFVYPLMMVT